MKCALVLISLLGALAGAQASTALPAANLGLQGGTTGPSSTLVQAFDGAPSPSPAPALGRSTSEPTATGQAAETTELGASSSTEAALVLLAAGVIALLAVARRRAPR